MKIAQIKPVQLEEGFLNNFITKLEDMAGEDGLTGIVRSLRGSGSSIGRIADAIKNGFSGQLRARLGAGYQAVVDGPAENVPVKEIIVLAIKSAEKISAADKNTVERSQIVAFLKKPANAKAIQIAAGTNVPVAEIVPAIIEVAGKRPATTSLQYEALVDGVSKTLAVVIVLIQAAATDADAGDMDENMVAQFKQKGQELLTLLLNPTNGFQPDQNYKDNLEHLFFVQMVKVIKDKYIALPNEKLVALAAAPPELISVDQLRSHLIMLNPSLDAGIVDPMTTKVHAVIQEQFKIWLSLAAQETASGAKAENSSKLYSTWLANADNMLSSMKLGGNATLVVKIGSQEIKPNDPLYDKIMAAVNGTA